MKLDMELNTLINEQVVHELRNANVYSQLAHYVDSLGLKNLSKYFENQSEDERKHAKKLMEFLADRVGGELSIGKIPETGLNVKSLSDVAKTYSDAETSTTALIENILYTSMRLMDFMTFSFMQWFIQEQLEEEKSATDFSNQVKNILESGNSLIILDQYYEE